MMKNKKSLEDFPHFHIKKTIEIEELKCVLTELVYEPNGAEIIHIGCEDPENVFCLAFPTLPTDSKGTPHIMEHTVLCGSQKYPVKDPFFSMTRRSLNTYMNALTGPDFTCYPAASMVKQDFYNLLEVYLDAVFHPLLREESFRQEGHRLEFQEPTNPLSPLTYKGVVFNEMKGGMSSPVSRLWNELVKALFPTHYYRFNFGGEPKDIPNLTYEEFLAFHKSIYQESLCLFYFYGNIPLKDHLDFLTKKVFHKTEKGEKPLFTIQPKLKEPKLVTAHYPIAEGEPLRENTYIVFSWLTCSILPPIEALAVQVLENILMGTDASPLKQELLKSGLLKNASCHLDEDLAQLPFVIVLEGCDKENLVQIEKLIFDSLQNIIEKGIPPELVEGSIHQIEFERMEVTHHPYPFGLSLFLRSRAIKQYGGPIEEGLRIKGQFESLRKLFEDPSYLKGMIKRYLIDNPHYIKLAMEPDPTLHEKEELEEKEKLKTLKSHLSSLEISQILEKTEKLKSYQERKDEPSLLEKLPNIHLRDVPKKTMDYPLSTFILGTQKVHFCDTFTNDILYAALSFDIPHLAAHEIPYVKLFAFLLPQLGTLRRSYQESLQLLQNYTGGLEAFLEIQVSSDDLNLFIPTLRLQGKALRRNQFYFLQFLKEYALEANFDDPERIKTLLHQHFTELDQEIKHHAIKSALSLSSSQLTPASYALDLFQGLPYFRLIKSLTQNLERELPTVIEILQKLQKKILQNEGYHLIISSSSDQFSEVQKGNFSGLLELPTQKHPSFELPFQGDKTIWEGRVLSSPVAFTALALKVPEASHSDTPALSVCARLMENTSIHALVREQGGAYGGGAIHKSDEGKFYFFGFRDPHLFTTYQAFQVAIQSVLKKKFTEKELEEAKLGVLQKLDVPISPENRGLIAYNWLRESQTLKKRQQFRDRLFSLTADDILKACDHYLHQGFSTGHLATFASKSFLEKEKKLFLKEKLEPFKIKEI